MSGCTINCPSSQSIASQRERFFKTRTLSVELSKPLSAEDMVVQAGEEASPTKWHLAHVTWFFETFILMNYLPDYRLFDPSFNYCFNSYYNYQGERQPRSKRGMLTRPSIDRIFAYRVYVDEAMEQLFSQEIVHEPAVHRLIEIGIQHEEQHQELLLTDILALFAANPLRPAYREKTKSLSTPSSLPAMNWITIEGGIFIIGHDGQSFCWDQETPRHQSLIHPFRIADRLITKGEWLNFMADGGYKRASLWLSDGWSIVKQEGWRAPLYWEEKDGEWLTMSLEGLQLIDRISPVAHISYYEADAFARWSGKRLPTEFEWETAANHTASHKLQQLFGEVWQWTMSAYLPYPGYHPPEGALGEYNGKFMVNQQVLRGSSFATPKGHSRTSYRNFFYPHQRWQFLGLRLAEEVQ